MKMKMPAIPDWEVKRPFVCFGKGFGALALLFGVFTPFLPHDDFPASPWVFLLCGLAYSAFLAFFTTGIGLLPNPIRRRVMTGVMFSFLWVMLCLAAILVSLHFYPSLSAFRVISQLLPWVLGTMLAAGFAFAFYGWYYRLVRHRTP